MEIRRTHQSSFRRQLHEAVTIMKEPGEVMKNQIEYKRFLISTMDVKGQKVLRQETGGTERGYHKRRN